MSINITDAIFSWSERSPGALALIDAKRSVTYRALCHAIRLAAQRFYHAGWEPGDVVGVSLPGNPALHLVCVLALARMGITNVAMPPQDTASVRAARVKRLRLKGLVINQRSRAVDANLANVTPDPEWFNAPHAATANDIRAPGGERLWVINETSGTTAAPKTIGISHSAEDAHHTRLQSVLTYLPGERFLSWVPLHFLSAIKRSLYCLREGATVTLPPVSYRTTQVLDWMDQHRVSFMTCVPLHLSQILRDVEGDDLRLPQLRILRCSSSTLPAPTLQAVLKKISPNVFVDYGCTEFGTATIATPAMLEKNQETIGRPLPAIEFEIADDHDMPVPAGTFGHVRVRGPGVDNCYLHTPSTEKSLAFRDGWFYPGDVAAIDSDGLVFLKGRSDDVMNYDGIMVGPAEIELVLQQHPLVREVAAFALPSQDHQDIPAVAIVADAPLPLAELQRFCALRLGVRAPRIFLQFDEIPKNPSGKVLRRQLTEQAIARGDVKQDPRVQ